jgi:creatinine amidohydrolase/Fe(II)-dependent formamide hydrolase-like protein
VIDTSLVQGRLTDKWRLDEMTWPEVRAAIESGRTTVIAAAGSMEQHGPHLPLQTDTLLGTFLVEAIVERVPGAFMGPTIPFGVSTHHMPFAGTITLDEETFKTVVRQYAESLAAHGFKNIVIIPSHGGNFGPLGQLEAELGGRVGDARFLAFSDLMGFMTYFERVASADGIDLSVAGAHAGEAETSLVLAANERLAQMEYAIEGYVGDFGEEAARTIFTQGMPALTDNGILGDARPATRERGFRYRDTMADALAEWIRERIPS